MSDFFGGGGSWKSSVDNYYTFTQTSGGGSSGGGKGCGTAIVILIIIAIAFSGNILAFLIALGCIGLMIGIAYLVLKWTIADKKDQKRNQPLSADNPEREGSQFIGVIHIAGTGYIENKKSADDSTAIGEELTLLREPDNPHDSKAIIILNKTGMKLGYVPRNQNTYPAECMDNGKELFARLRAKSFTGNHLTMTAELFVRDERAAT